jgi:hypothetical protein
MNEFGIKRKQNVMRERKKILKFDLKMKNWATFEGRRQQLPIPDV